MTLEKTSVMDMTFIDKKTGKLIIGISDGGQTVDPLNRLILFFHKFKGQSIGLCALTNTDNAGKTMAPKGFDSIKVISAEILPPKEILHLKEIAIDLGSKDRKVSVPIKYLDQIEFTKITDNIMINGGPMHPGHIDGLNEISSAMPEVQKRIKSERPELYKAAMKLKDAYKKCYMKEIKINKIKPGFRLLLKQTKTENGFFLVNLDTKKKIKIEFLSKPTKEITKQDYEELIKVLVGKKKEFTKYVPEISSESNPSKEKINKKSNSKGLISKFKKFIGN